MARVKVKFPEGNPMFETRIPVRIGDVNYGGHVGNDALLSIIHEARVQWLAACGFTELNAGGHGLIMADVAIAYKSESFYGDVLQADVFADELSAVSFELLYRLSAKRKGEDVLIAAAKTGMVCFDYAGRKVCEMSEALSAKLAK